MLKVMIVDSDLKRTTPLKQSLLDSGYEVIAHIKDMANLDAECCELQPDIVIIDTESPSRDTLENICVMTMHEPRPIVMFTHDDDKAKIKAATQAGVCAYVVGNIPSERLTPVIDAAVARFEEFKNLRSELNLAKNKLEERKVIEQAKGLLMKQRNLDEDEAYNLLRSIAMKKNMKLADLSNQLIEAAKMLIV
ncbi:MAG: ANTAR domain-containing response regulator [Methylophilaceae bacterium]